MEHVVFFPAPDGTPAFRRVAALEDAVRLVEHLRNVEGVPEVHVHPLGDEVPLAFRTWYRVEVPAAPVEPEPVALAAQPAAEPAVAEPAAVEPPAEPAGTAVAEPLPAQTAAVPVPEVPAQVPPLEPVGQPPAESNGHREDVKSLGFFA